MAVGLDDLAQRATVYHLDRIIDEWPATSGSSRTGAVHKSAPKRGYSVAGSGKGIGTSVGAPGSCRDERAIA